MISGYHYFWKHPYAWPVCKRQLANESEMFFLRHHTSPKESSPFHLGFRIWKKQLTHGFVECIYNFISDNVKEPSWNVLPFLSTLQSTLPSDINSCIIVQSQRWKLQFGDFGVFFWLLFKDYHLDLWENDPIWRMASPPTRMIPL